MVMSVRPLYNESSTSMLYLPLFIGKLLSRFILVEIGSDEL